MRRMKKITLLVAAVLCLSGCGGTEGSNKATGGVQSNVDKVMEEQIANADGNTTDTQNENDNKKDNADNSGATAPSTDVDYDLTAMNSDMVYSTVYQMVTNPDSYVGKTVRMGGAYIVNYWESTDTYYHCVLIKDAQACCQQGMEFVWDDGSHKYPDEYPEQQTEVLVTGTFETYKEAGDENLYCRLKDATLVVE